VVELKILLFINSLAGGGAERVVATLANHWAGQNWDVTVVTLAPADEDFYVLAPSVRRVSLDLSGVSSNALHGALQNARRIIALRRTIHRLRPRVAISMMSTPNVLLSFASHGMDGLSTVGSERCYPPHAPLGYLWSGLRKLAYARLSAVVALTRECAQWVETHTSARYVPVIPNAVTWPLPEGTPRVAPDMLCGPERRVLLAVGRLDAVKNYGMLITVFSRIAGKYPKWNLVILGEGPERPTLEAAIHALKLERRILMPGIAGNIGEWHAHSDLYVLSSESEGFPNALAEALCHGLPAVSFDCDTGPRDIIRHGVDGLLAAAGDALALEQALDRLMGDEKLRQQFAVKARDARQRFCIERIAGMWEALFRELADVHASSRFAGNMSAKRGYRT
jgi:glycosyltransferase involved in cell wall biosynthesis